MSFRPDTEFDSTAVPAAFNGDARAMDELCAHYYPQILGIARRVATRAGASEDAPELAQEVWCRLLDDHCRKIRCYRPERGAFGPFLRMVAWQQAALAISAWISHRRSTRPLEAACHRSRPAANCAEAYDCRQFVDQIFNFAAPRLDVVDRVLLEDIVLGESPAREIAPRVGYSPAALYKRRQRLRGKLHVAAQQLAEHELLRLRIARGEPLPAAV